MIALLIGDCSAYKGKIGIMVFLYGGLYGLS